MKIYEPCSKIDPYSLETDFESLKHILLIYVSIYGEKSFSILTDVSAHYRGKPHMKYGFVNIEHRTHVSAASGTFAQTIEKHCKSLLLGGYVLEPWYKLIVFDNLNELMSFIQK